METHLGKQWWRTDEVWNRIFLFTFPISIVKEVVNKGSVGEKYLGMLLTSCMLKVDHKQEEIS